MLGCACGGIIELVLWAFSVGGLSCFGCWGANIINKISCKRHQRACEKHKVENVKQEAEKSCVETT